MDLWELKPGDTIRTKDGAIARIIDQTEDGEWIKVSYLAFAEDSSIVGTEDLCHEDEVLEVVQPGTALA